MEYNYIDGRIRESLQDLEVNPPVEAWLGISDALEKKPVRRAMPIFFQVAAAITTLMVAVFSFWYLVLNRAVQDGGIVQQSVSADVEPMASNTSPPLNAAEPFGSDLRSSQPAPVTSAQAAVSGSSSPMPLLASLNSRLFASDPVLATQVSGAGLLPDAPVKYQDGFFFMDEAGNKLLEYISSSFDVYPGGVSLGAHFSPQYNFRKVAAKGDYGFTDIPFHALEEQIMTFSMGLSAYFEIAPRLTIQTGVNLMSMGQYVRDIVSYSHPAKLPLYNNSITGRNAMPHPQSIITSQGNIRLNDNHYYFADTRSGRVMTNKQAAEGTDPVKLTRNDDGLTQLFRFIELPLVLRYNLLSQGVGIQVKGGMAGNYLLQNAVYLGSDLMQMPIGETHGIRKFNFSAIAGFSMDIPVTGRLTLHLEPTAQIFLNPVIREDLLMGRTFPYSFSLQTGFSYGF